MHTCKSSKVTHRSILINLAINNSVRLLTLSYVQPYDVNYRVEITYSVLDAAKHSNNAMIGRAI